MTTVILGAVFGILCGMIIGSGVGEKAGLIVTTIFVAVTTLIVLLPVEGFCDKECVSEYLLLPLRRRQTGQKRYYIQISNRKATFAFDNGDEYELDGVAYQEKTIKGKIILYESDEEIAPVLKVFKKSPSRKFWTYAPFSTKTEYVFFVPMGSTLSKNGKERQNVNDVV